MAEEVALIMDEKLTHLQSLYIDQFKQLQHLLKEKKHLYLHNCKVEHEVLGSSRLTGQKTRELKAIKISPMVLSTLWSGSLATQAAE